MGAAPTQYRIPVVMQPGECCLTGRMLHDVLASFADPEHVGRTTDHLKSLETIANLTHT